MAASKDSSLRTLLWFVGVLFAAFWWAGILMEGGHWAFAVVPDIGEQELLGVTLGVVPFILIAIGIALHGTVTLAGKLVQVGYVAFIVLDLAIFSNRAYGCRSRGDCNHYSPNSIQELTPALQPAMFWTILPLAVLLIGYGLLYLRRKRQGRAAEASAAG